LENYQGDWVYYFCCLGIVVSREISKETRQKMSLKRKQYWEAHFNHSTIDWNNIIETYGYSSEESFLRSMIGKFRPSEIADSVGVSVPTIRSRLDYYFISRNHFRGGGNYSVHPKKDSFLLIPEVEMFAMTLSEIAKKAGCSVSWARMLCKRYHRSYKKEKHSPKKDSFLLIPKTERRKMNRTQIMNSIDCSRTYIGTLCKKY